MLPKTEDSVIEKLFNKIGCFTYVLLFLAVLAGAYLFVGLVKLAKPIANSNQNNYISSNVIIEPTDNILIKTQEADALAEKNFEEDCSTEICCNAVILEGAKCTTIPQCKYSRFVSCEFPTEQKTSCPNGCTTHVSGCDIKGNINYESTERIYHLPGMAYYDDTTINPDYGERWFCTEAEAIANGWRKGNDY